MNKNSEISEANSKYKLASHTDKTITKNLDVDNSTDKLNTDQLILSLSAQACYVLNELRCKSILCDAIIRVTDDTEFSIHTSILSGRLLLYLMKIFQINLKFS